MALAATPDSSEVNPVPTDTPSAKPGPRPLSITLAGVLATIVLLAVILTFVRLGFWQLARLQERKASNRAIAARIDTAPITDAATLADTLGLFYRNATVHGVFDDERSIILPGRSMRGLPGVHLITPLLLAGRTDAVLVNRGWVPSPDAATIDIADFATHGETVALTGLVVPFPGPRESLAPAQHTAVDDSAFRRVWFSIEEDRLRSQFPYPLLPVLLQQRAVAGEPTGRGHYPAHLDAPALDEGPHLGYALQWFSFALIGVIGWIALVRRSRNVQRVVPPIVFVILFLATSGNAHAQLRPHDPLDWRIFDGDVDLIASVGAGMLRDQPAPLAGSVGRLLELGTYNLIVRSGRLAVEFNGTAVWRLQEDSQREQPADFVRPAPDGIRQDAGPAHAGALMLISPSAWPVDVMLRFGATIPTTGFPSGLDRDRTDFFAFAGARYARGAFTIATEQGLGINGTAFGRNPQSDMWTYSLTGAWSFNALRASAGVVGQQDGHRGRIRGNEDQREMRVGLQAGRRQWLAAELIHGLTRYSPGTGVRISAGFLLR
jgi:surfeit locus 1 family protein